MSSAFETGVTQVLELSDTSMLAVYFVFSCVHSVAYDHHTVRAARLLDAGHSAAVGPCATSSVHVCMRFRDVDSSVATGSLV